jgi:serine/threonine protein kinase
MGNRHINSINNKQEVKKVERTKKKNLTTKELAQVNFNGSKCTQEKAVDDFNFRKTNTANLSFENFSENVGPEKLISKTPKVKNQNKIITNNEDNTKYIVERVVGRGFYSKVYKVKKIIQSSNNIKKEISTFYAAKCLSKKKIIHNNLYNKIKTEKTILENLKTTKNGHFIIELISSFHTEKHVFFIFEFFELDLFSLLKFNKAFNEVNVKFILAQIYIALTYIHSKKIIYRDLKPENIMIDSKTGYIKLADFGLACQLQGENDKIREICGTNEYIPPEVVNQEEYSFDFDWWGFGIFMYEILTGCPPFTGKNQKDIFDKIRTQTINLEYLLISSEAKDLLLILLNKDRDMRILPEQIPFHPFFKGINFNEIKEIKLQSPLKPLINSYLGQNKNNFFIDTSSCPEFSFLKNKLKDVMIDQEIFKDF